MTDPAPGPSASGSPRASDPGLRARPPWVAILAGTALAALALSLTLWSKQLTKEARRAECAARAQTIAFTVQATLEDHLREPDSPLVRSRREIAAGAPAPAPWLSGLQGYAGKKPLPLSDAAGRRAATYVPGSSGGVLVEWDLERVEREVVLPALSEASVDRYEAVLVRQPAPVPELRIRAQSPLFPPLAHWSVGVGFADRSAVRRDLRLQTALLGLLSGGLLLALVASVLASARRARRRHERGVIRDQLLTRATHELQTPLALLRAAVETLGSQELEPADRERCLEIVLREEGRLTETLRRLLRTLRWEGATFRWGPLGPALVDAIAALRPTVEAAGLDLSLELEEVSAEAPSELVADTLRELVGNALKHAQGATRLTLRLRLAGERALLEVQDDGPGIDPSAGDPFQAFTRGDAATPGSGLGLALLREGWGAIGGKVGLGPGPGGHLRVEIPLR